MTKQFLASVMVLALATMVVGVGVNAATTVDVSATVTSELIAVSVEDGTVDYGILPVNTNADTVILNQTQVVTNDSNVAADLEVKSSDAVGGTQWNLVATTGLQDEFTHEFSSNGGAGWTAFSVDNSVYTSFAASVVTGGTKNLDLRIKTPTSVTDNNVVKTITVTVLVTATN